MKLVEECFIETRQIFMNNSESSVLKCKVWAQWHREFQVFPVCVWNGSLLLCFPSCSEEAKKPAASLIMPRWLKALPGAGLISRT